MCTDIRIDKGKGINTCASSLGGKSSPAFYSSEFLFKKTSSFQNQSQSVKILAFEMSAAIRTSRASYFLEEEVHAISKNRKGLKEKQAEAGLADCKGSDVCDEYRIAETADGSIPTVFSRKYFGLACSYFIVGIFLGISGFLQPLVILLNHKDAVFYSSSAQLITIFWSYKVFYGFFIDFVPIFGYSKKIYQLLGSGVSIAITFVLAFVSEEMSIEAILGLMTIQNFFSVMADCANDGFTCYLSHRETEATRGKTLTWVYSARFVGTMVTFIIAALGMSGPYYSGNFDFELSVNNNFLVLAICAAVPYPFLFFCMDEERYLDTTSGRTVMGELKALVKLLKNKAIYQLMFFMIVNQTFMGFTNNANTNYASITLGMDGFQNNLNLIFQYTLLIIGMQVVKRYGLRYNWVYMFIITFIIQVILTNLVYLFVWNVTHNVWAYVVLSATNQFPYGMNFIISSFFMVEIASPGNEALVFALFSTVHNICIPLSTVLSNQLMKGFTHLTTADFEADSHEMRVQWSYYQLAVTALMCCCLIVMPIFPAQKEAARSLVNMKPNSTWAVLSTLLVLLCLVYATVCTILTIVPSTQCLAFIGGDGC